MTSKPTLLLCLLACASLSGCTLCQIAKRTILDEPSEFSWMEDRKRSIEVYRTWADRAWSEQCSSDPEQCLSQAYVAGFKDGFVDYVYGGGSGEPPPVPPRPFWNMEERNPRGHSAATDWFAGYRYGAQVAREGGFRERALVPSSMFLLGSQELGSQELGALEGDWSDQQPYAEPLPNPIAEPLQPEFIPPAQLQPEAKAKDSEPELPTLPTPTIEMPNVGVPAVEDLPPSPAVPEADDPLQQPAPIETPPKENTPSLELDDIFGSSKIDQSSQISHREKFKKVIHRDLAAQEARAAFASAIRGHRAKIKNPSKSRLLKSDLDGKFRHQEFRETFVRTTTFSQPKGEPAAIPTPGQATIPKSEDGAEELFRLLTR